MPFPKMRSSVEMKIFWSASFELFSRQLYVEANSGDLSDLEDFSILPIGILACHPHVFGLTQTFIVGLTMLIAYLINLASTSKTF